MLAPLVIELHAIECGPTDLEIRVHHSAVSPQEQLCRLGLRGKLHGADNGGVRAGVGEHHGVAHFHLGHVRIGKDQIRTGAEVRVSTPIITASLVRKPRLYCPNR